MRAIFYKEWIKTAGFIIVMAIVLYGIAGYVLLNINRIAEIKGMEHLWEVMITRDVLLTDIIKYVPLLIGILLGTAQWAPEMHRKCLKLTLHLPVSNLKTINIMLAYGGLVLCLMFALEFVVLLLWLSPLLPVELMRHILLTMFVWHLAGVLAYFLSSWILLEPTWRMRVVNIVVSFLLLRIFFLADVPEAYNPILPLLTLFTILSVAFVWNSIARFKSGCQD